jgi:hypothetical protein
MYQNDTKIANGHEMHQNCHLQSLQNKPKLAFLVKKLTYHLATLVESLHITSRVAEHPVATICLVDLFDDFMFLFFKSRRVGYNHRNLNSRCLKVKKWGGGGSAPPHFIS